ncbi:(2Fe-2S) ferredoxin domain-containing protein [Cellulosilyticum sp. I15G10I2]|uniref:(2Fe-2S) ferredoxin domain-containing protein n=1 Tax=Cellulosilyticum sp. I15G10I2 TaxID=1892843 RepID=UPI00085C9B5D|nr:(2Fe-2S) ferredoxin domain-containing protein [Cellulosilyticum sp. I15G10I2]
MKIKSLEELKQIKEEYKDRVRLRSKTEEVLDQTEILIGMATCGISSGSRETLNAIIDELAKENRDDIKVIPVGCIGYCHSEPTVQVNIKGQKPIIYGNMKKENVHELIEKHIKGGQPVERFILSTHFESM